MDHRNLHIVVVSTPGIGHVIPVLVLAKRLATLHGVRVTIVRVTVAGAPPEPKLFTVPYPDDLVRILQLPPVDISHVVDESTQIVTRLFMMFRAAASSLRSAISALEPRPDAIVADLFSVETPGICTGEFDDIPKFYFIASNAWFSALAIYSPILDREIAGEYADLHEKLAIPGCVSVAPEDVPDPMLDRNDEQYGEYLKIGRSIPLFDGILISTWEELEKETLKAFRENETWKSIIDIPVYPIGPLTRPAGELKPSSELFSWLDKQPDDSVLFVSFGSGGVLSPEQTTELAWGLELSRQRFVWVVRPPTSGRADDEFFTVGGERSQETLAHLPEGFVARTGERAILIPMWAEQLEILSHPAVGGFLSHCGWNSTLESITNGIPMIAWPLYAEQRMNATLLTDQLSVAVRPAVLPAKKVVSREEVARLVRSVMEDDETGRRMRERAQQLKITGAEALINGGSSHKSLSQLLSKITASKKKQPTTPLLM
ncbi:hypothetical protein M569_07987 [Genlisea aurea]|uniref:Glycosyltransferase n=1 Tax=Genlisea aurea TaxID=192259 RepID=S8E3D6_9LAMI|nr:hypothetical protein M569_07987 [Genlisea aurea]